MRGRNDSRARVESGRVCLCWGDGLRRVRGVWKSMSVGCVEGDRCGLDLGREEAKGEEMAFVCFEYI